MDRSLLGFHRPHGQLDCNSLSEKYEAQTLALTMYASRKVSYEGYISNALF
jgi:hypothetical protein